MQVSELMTANPDCCSPWDTLGIAGEIMLRRRCGFVPVVVTDSHRTKRVIGVLTDRDIALYLTRTDAQASHTKVERCMTKEPKTVHPDADLEEAAEIMEKAALHRLPVVEDGRLIGVLSLKDIARAARKEWGRLGMHVAEQQMKDILEAIAVSQSSE